MFFHNRKNLTHLVKKEEEIFIYILIKITLYLINYSIHKKIFTLIHSFFNYYKLLNCMKKVFLKIYTHKIVCVL